MVADKDDIIVFRSFDTVIDANIAKTKLDAYGIPCFLTEENMSNLYPGQPFLAFKVRLHLFAKDEERAQSLLEENSLSVVEDSAEESTNRCPACHSMRVTRDFPKDESDNLAFIFFGVLMPHRKINRCQDCECEF